MNGRRVSLVRLFSHPRVFSGDYMLTLTVNFC
jgi:hypothetical protein